MFSGNKTFMTAVTLLLGVIVVTPAYAAGEALQDTSDAGIALSNSYAGNSWRQQMLQSWRSATEAAISDGVIAKTKIVNANNSASQQANQIGNLILQGWDAIVIDAASPTALNGIIQQACNAGIVVVVFDALATAPCAYKVATDNVYYGTFQTDYVTERLDGEINVLEIRGIAGTSVDDDVHTGIVEGFSDNSNVNIVGSVHGNWTQTITQKRVAGILPTLPQVDAVVTQGGDGWGAYQAFKEAGRPIPLIVFGNRKVGLKLWKTLSEQKGYETTSISVTPGIASVAFWVAQQVLAGRDMPKKIAMPLLHITKENLNAWIEATPDGGVATPVYSQDWTIQLIQAVKQDTPLPKTPLPGKAKASTAIASDS